MNFISLTIDCDEEKRELLIAELSLFPFDAFEETDSGLLVSCEEDRWEADPIKEILKRYGVTYRLGEVARINWNEEWEKNYDPVIVGDQCIVRATFHAPRPEIPYEIIITPKMSFGTGHHATTWQVLKYQLEMDQAGRKVLDVGCGTGALAIMAHKRGATDITAVDIDEWCIENSQENFALNHCETIKLYLGGIDRVSEEETFDIILANINKNVLMEQMKAYKIRMNKGAKLVLSGFYVDDRDELVTKGHQLGLEFEYSSEKNNWAMLVLKTS